MNSAQRASVWLSLALVACGGPRLLTVPTGPQPAKAAPVKVDYPPPPAKIEEIRIARSSGSRCVWRDGYWDWTGERWEWQDGRAVLPAKGCLYAEGKLQWTTDSLSFYRPAWYPDPAQNPAAKTCTEVGCLPVAGSANPENPAPSP
ncbi:MAG TPA: YXWGXW repeat-containing protein [Polyangiaceae bacterium]